MILTLRVFETTDGKYLGREFVVDTDNIGAVEVEPGVVFRVRKVEKLDGGIFRFFNDNYVAYARVVI
jgi:hypothetical protein